VSSNRHNHFAFRIPHSALVTVSICPRPSEFPRLAANMALPSDGESSSSSSSMTWCRRCWRSRWVLSIRRLLPAAAPEPPPSAWPRPPVRCRGRGYTAPHRERARAAGHHLDEVSASVVWRAAPRRSCAITRRASPRGHPAPRCRRSLRAVNLAGHLSRQLSRPIDELVGWTQLIRRHEPLRSARQRAVHPSSKRCARRCASWPPPSATARDRELEAERLRTFREVARRVAHEIKNPLTSMRIAVDSTATADGRPTPDGHCRAGPGRRD